MLDLILTQLRANPPAGVDPEYVAAFARRHRPELERLVAQLDAGDGRLYDRFGTRGAPKVGERGYKPPAERSPGPAMLARAYAGIEDPDFAAAWSATVGGDGEWHPADEEDHEELVTDFLDLHVGVPDRALDGRVYTHEDRAYIALWITDLAMLAHPEKHWGTSWDGGETYLRHRPAGEPVPYWLAEAMAEDAFQPDLALRLVNVPLDTACEYVRQHHRHLPDCNRRGLMYAIGVTTGRRLAAVATAGSPTGRWNGRRVSPHDVLELTRVASDGTVLGAASKLTARLIDLLPASRRGSGPALFVTYQLAAEEGTPYRALREKGLRPVERIPGKAAAGGARRGDDAALRAVDKIRWEAGPAAMPARWDLLENAA